MQASELEMLHSVVGTASTVVQLTCMWVILKCVCVSLAYRIKF